jgi:hypothetical protein
MTADSGVKIIQVDAEAQAVDLEIIRLVESGDVVVTQDFGLAAVVLSRGGRCLSPWGKEYSNQNIDGLLAQRHLDQRHRRGGGRIKGPSAYKVEDRQRFEGTLRRTIDALQENEMGGTNGQV